MEPHDQTDRQPALSPAEKLVAPAPQVEAPPAPPQAATLKEWLKQNQTTLLGVVLFLVFAFFYWGLGPIITVAGVCVGLGFVIFIHELGHFATSKWCDVHVKTFSIGFGPALPGCTYQRGETTYMIGALPLGGYVQMVGEGSEEEDEVDPRSFKNKKVWQRMVIISAGVVMNVILGFICFILVFTIRGLDQVPGIVNTIDPGSAAWTAGVPSGAVVDKLGNVQHPYFADFMNQVHTSREGQSLAFDYRWEDYAKETTAEPVIENTKTEVEPRKKESDPAPKIGVSPPGVLRLPPAIPGKKDPKPPAIPGSAAEKANPPFAWGDQIVGTTDPDQPADKYDPKLVKELPRDWRFTKEDRDWRPSDEPRYDYFAFERRLRQLAGKPVVIRVKRTQPKKDDDPKAEPVVETVDVTVPPTFHSVIGLRMKMGKVVAVRQNSPAADAKIQPTQGKGGQAEADQITAVEVVDENGKTVKWVPNPTAAEERPLDPMRLPFELAHWAARKREKLKVAVLPKGGDNTVKVTVLRTNAHKEEPTVIDVAYDDDPKWRYESEFPLGSTSPMAIGGLGLAYQVDADVVAADKNAPPAHRGSETGETFTFEPGDIIKAVCYYEPGKKESAPGKNDGEPGKPSEKTYFFFFKQKAWNEIDPTQNLWPIVFANFQSHEDKRVILKVGRNKEEIEVYVTPQIDETWPLAERGIPLLSDFRLQKADGVVEAIGLGMKQTYGMIRQVYQQLPNLASGRIDPKNLRGPVGIFETAYTVAGHDWFIFLFFLGAMSINLAVVNFLPIPVLDGGHMVFLLYEAAFRRPASEQVKMAANYVGLGLILSLMVFVLYIDLKRLLM